MNHCRAPKLDRETSAPSDPQQAVPLGTRTPFSRVPPPGPSADLRAFFPSCSGQSLLSRGAGRAWVTSLPHGPGFPGGSLGKADRPQSQRPRPSHSAHLAVPPRTPSCLPRGSPGPPCWSPFPGVE